MKILIIALSGIGDALMFTPAVKLLKDSYPESEIDALVMFKGVEDIYSRLNEINKIHFHDYLKADKWDSLKFTIALRKKYDISINVYPANRIEYNLINFIIGARKRSAVKYLRSDLINLGFLNNVRVTEDDVLHNVEENIKLVEKITGNEASSIPQMEFPLKKEETKFAAAFLKKHSISSSDLILGIHPGCATLKNHINRRWAPLRFAELSKMLIRNNDAKIFIFGGPDENELKEEVKAITNSPDAILVNTGSIGETAAVMKYCKIFITNDSSLMHVASSLKLNTVAIIGPTNTSYIHPWKTNYKIASLFLECSPCFYYSPKPLICTREDVKYKCVKQLEVQQVYNKVLEFLE